MKIKLFCTLTLFSILLVNPLFADGNSFSLRELVKEALEKNYQIKIYKNEELKLENSNSMGMAGFYPVLSLDGSKSLSNSNTKQTLYTGDVRQSNNAVSDVSSAALNLNWNFFDGFKMFATKSKLHYLEKLGKENTRFFIEQTTYDIASAYYQLIIEIEKLTVLNESVKYSEDRLNLIKEKIKIGSSNNFELKNAQFDLNQDSILIIQQKEIIKQLILDINKVLIKSENYEFAPSEKITLNKDISKEFIVNQALENNSSLSSDKIRNLITNQDVAINESSFYPTIGAFASYNFQDQTNTVSIYRSNRSYGINYGLKFSFNLYNGNQDATNYQNAKIDLENSELQIKDKENEIKNLVEKSYSTYTSSAEVYKLTKNNADLSKETLEIAKKQLEVGSINSFDFRQVQLDFINSNLIANESELQIKLKELELLKLGGVLLNTLMQ